MACWTSFVPLISFQRNGNQITCERPKSQAHAWNAGARHESREQFKLIRWIHQSGKNGGPDSSRGRVANPTPSFQRHPWAAPSKLAWPRSRAVWLGSPLAPSSPSLQGTQRGLWWSWTPTWSSVTVAGEHCGQRQGCTVPRVSSGRPRCWPRWVSAAATGPTDALARPESAVTCGAQTSVGGTSLTVPKRWVELLCGLGGYLLRVSMAKISVLPDSHTQPSSIPLFNSHLNT